jgi:hypothetical protein
MLERVDGRVNPGSKPPGAAAGHDGRKTEFSQMRLPWAQALPFRQQCLVLNRRFRREADKIPP